MDDDDDIMAFRLPDGDAHPGTIGARLMSEPTHRHLSENDVSFGWLLRCAPKDKAGKRELGSVHTVKTMFQGAFKDLGIQLLAGLLGYTPDYLIIVDAQWWAQANDIEREALIFHELCHVRQALDRFGAPKFDRDGLPVFAVVEHDITAFNSEVARYGAWHPDIGGFLAAARGT